MECMDSSIRRASKIVTITTQRSHIFYNDTYIPYICTMGMLTQIQSEKKKKSKGRRWKGQRWMCTWIYHIKVHWRNEITRKRVRSIKQYMRFTFLFFFFFLFLFILLFVVISSRWATEALRLTPPNIGGELVELPIPFSVCSFEKCFDNLWSVFICYFLNDKRDTSDTNMKKTYCRVYAKCF